MTDEAVAEPIIAAPDLKVPPDPFNHGPCRFNKANGSKEDCPNPAVFEGGMCAAHAAVIAAANTQTEQRTGKPTPAFSKDEWAKRKAREKAAKAARRRNRR